MEVVLSCIKLGAQVWGARPGVLFSSSLQEVFFYSILFHSLIKKSSFFTPYILYSGTYLQIIIFMYILNNSICRKHSAYCQIHK